MKEVVVDTEKTQIPLSKITNESFVGIKWQDRHKSFVFRKEKDGEFIGIDPRGIVSCKNLWKKASIEEYVETAIKSLGARAYVFNDWRELFTWLVE